MVASAIAGSAVLGAGASIFGANQASKAQQSAAEQNLEMQRQMEVLNAKLDGTYDPSVHDPKPVDPESIRMWGSIEGRAQASYAAHSSRLGEDNVIKALEKYASIFGQDRSVQERVLVAADPIKAAMDAVDSYEFFQQYGADIPGIVNKIRQQVETELEAKVAKKLQSKLVSKDSEPRGIGRVQGSSGAEDQEVTRSNAGRQRSLEDIFGR